MVILHRSWLLAAALVALAVAVHDAAPAPAHAVQPAVPTNVRVSPGDGKLTLTWSAPSDWRSLTPSGYEIDVAGGEFYGSASPLDTSDHVDWEPLAQTAATATSYTFAGTILEGGAHEHTVTNGTRYHLRVRALGSDHSDTHPSDWVVVSATPQAQAGTLSMMVEPTSLTVPVGSRACYLVRPNSKPTGPLSITTVATAMVQLSRPGTSDRRVAGSAVNWKVGTPICVKGVTAGSTTITHAVESDDTNYDGITTPSVSVTVTAADEKPTVRFLHSEIRAVEGSTAMPNYGSRMHGIRGEGGPGDGPAHAYGVREVTVRLDIAPAPSSSGQITWLIPHPHRGGCADWQEKCFDPGYTGTASYNIDFVAQGLIARQLPYTSGSNDMEFEFYIRSDSDVEGDETVTVYVLNRKLVPGRGVVDNNAVCVGACDSDTSDIDSDRMTFRIIDDDTASNAPTSG